jgi:hypothetical protein
VHIAETPMEFIAAADAALDLARNGHTWLEEVDRELAEISWERTWAQMAALVETATRRRDARGAPEEVIVAKPNPVTTGQRTDHRH